MNRDAAAQSQDELVKEEFKEGGAMLRVVLRLKARAKVCLL